MKSAQPVRPADNLALETSTLDLESFVRRNQEAQSFPDFHDTFNIVRNLRIKYGLQHCLLSAQFAKGLLEDPADRVLFVLRNKRSESPDEIRE